MKSYLLVVSVVLMGLSARLQAATTFTLHIVNSTACDIYGVFIFQGYTSSSCSGTPGFCCGFGSIAASAQGTILAGGSKDQVVDLNDGAFCGDYAYKVTWSTNASGTGTVFDSGGRATGSAGSSVTVTCSGACPDAPPPEWHCASLSFQNSDSVGHWYIINHNSDFAVNTIYLVVGASYSTNYCCTNCPPQSFSADRIQTGTDATDQHLTGNNNHTNSASTAPNSGGGPISGQTTNVIAATNSGAIWQGGTQATITNAASGASAVYDAITKLGTQEHADMVNLSNAVAHGPSSSGGIGTNVNVTNPKLNVDTGGATNNETVAFGPVNTNASAAWAAAEGLLGTARGDIISITNTLGSVSDTFSDMGTGGSPSELEFAFVPGYTINLDPEVRFPGFMEKVFCGWTLIIVVIFLKWLTQYAWSVVKMMATVETGGVPDAEAEVLGSGGNVVGIIVALLVFAAVIAIYVFVIGTIVSIALSYFHYFPDAAVCFHTHWGPSAGGPSTSAALYLLNNSFPVHTLLTLLIARFTIPWGTILISGTAATALRMMPGK